MVSFMGDTTVCELPFENTVKQMEQLNVGDAITPKKDSSCDCETIVL